MGYERNIKGLGTYLKEVVVDGFQATGWGYFPLSKDNKIRAEVRSDGNGGVGVYVMHGTQEMARFDPQTESFTALNADEMPWSLLDFAFRPTHRLGVRT